VAELVIQAWNSLVVCGRASSTDGFRSSQSALYTTAIGSDFLYSWFDSVSMARTLTCLYGKTIFEVLRSLLVFDRASPMGVTVSRWS